MGRFAALALAVVAAACSGTADAPAALTPTSPPTAAPTSAGPTLTAPSQATTTTASTTTAAPAPTTTVVTTTTTAAVPVPTTDDPPIHVLAPGTHHDDELVIHISFESEIDDLSSEDLEEIALEILNVPGGWNESGFVFVADPESQLRVVVAEGRRVDELCLPLDTGGKVSCQNGPVVALNADRWRDAFNGWTGSVDEYRHYLVTHEVGHLIGLRHPLDRCPTDDKVSAAMEPQTNNLKGCIGNGIPFEWELEWARNRPAVIGPTPDWDGPRPQWPTT